MINLSVQGDISEVERHLSTLQRRIIPASAASAMNRAIDSAATVAGREISQATRIPVRDVAKRLIKRRASADHLVAVLQALAYSPNLSEFRATQNKKGVAATAWETRKTYRHAFKLPSGRVVTRVGSKRFPLKGLRGPSVRKTFMQRRVLAAVDAIARQTWRTRFDHELTRRLSVGRSNAR